jgi:hypothetical protein
MRVDARRSAVFSSRPGTPRNPYRRTLHARATANARPADHDCEQTRPPYERGRARRGDRAREADGGGLRTTRRAPGRAVACALSEVKRRVSPRRGRESVQRLGLALLDSRRRARTPGWAHSRRQGQHLRRRHPDAERLVGDGGLRAERGRDGRHAPARRRRPHRRQDRRPGSLRRRWRDHGIPGASAAQPVGREASAGRILERKRRRRGDRAGGSRFDCPPPGADAAVTSRPTASCRTRESSPSS